MAVKIVKMCANLIIDSETKDKFVEDLKTFANEKSISADSRNVQISIEDADCTKGSHIGELYWGNLYKIADNINLIVLRIDKYKEVIFEVLGIIVSDEEVEKIKSNSKDFISKEFMLDHMVVYKFDASKRKKPKMKVSKFIKKKKYNKVVNLFDTENFEDVEKLDDKIIANLLTGYLKKELINF